MDSGLKKSFKSNVRSKNIKDTNFVLDHEEKETNLTKHIGAIHEENKPFKCDMCDYSCSQKKSMNIHVASVHKVKKPFKCDICGYSCSQKGNMNNHVAAIHERMKQFKCDIWDYSCS